MDTQTLSNPMELRTLLEQVEYAAASDGSRYALGGVHLENIADDVLVAVATDGHRMAIQRTAKLVLVLPKGGITISTKGVAAIKKTLHRKGGASTEFAASVAVTSTALVMTCHGRPTAEAELVDGAFPTWRSVLPKAPKAKDVTRLPCPKGPMAEALLGLAAFDCRAPIMVALTGRELLLSREYAIPGGTIEGKASFDDVRSTDPIEFGVNGYYLVDALTALRGAVTFSLGNPDGVIRMDDAHGGTAVVMPVIT